MTDPLLAEALDDATIRLIFALRDSLTEVDRLDFWQDRCATALETAAAGAEDFHQAVTTACRKLQIETLAATASKEVVTVADLIDGHYAEWAAHVHKNIIYILALARVENNSRKATKKTSGNKKDAWAAKPEAMKEPMF